jgi:hypothetical protein
MATQGASEAAAGPIKPASPFKSFFLSRWRGDAPLNTVFWRDMIGFGTSLNILAGIFGIILIAAEAPSIITFLIFVALLPWNLFLFLSVWRIADNAKGENASLPKMAAAIWLGLMLCTG